MFTSENIIGGDLPNVRIGIGCDTNPEIIERSVNKMNAGNIRIYHDPKELVKDLVFGDIDAAVRGSMASTAVFPILKEMMGVKELERVVLLEPKGGKLVFMVPVGIDEGWTISQKYDMTIKSLKIMKDLGASSRIAVMSGGRYEDIGRNPVVDRTIMDALELVRLLKNDKHDAYHAQILIEDAIEDADLIIAPDGITGNLIFRIMHFIGGANALGAPILNIDKVFVDTSRAKTDYMDSIALAMKLTEKKI